MPPLGAHMSIAGGYYKAVLAAARCQMDCVQVFTKNNNQWRAKEITPAEAEQFQDALREHEIGHPIAHTSYLINLGSPDKELRKKSIDALVVELRRAEQLGIPYVVQHPGAYIEGTEAAGLRRIASSINQALRRTAKLQAALLLENTAGQGTNLGWRFEHLGDILGRVTQQGRVGVCIDTCHALAAGYDIRERAGYRRTMRALDEAVGLDRVKAFHLNDSKRDLGSRVDRHEHIGRGFLGVEPFRLLLTDRRWRQTPMYMETPKGEENGQDLDVINLTTLRKLAGK